MSSSLSSPPRLAGVFSSGRSGSTWLGAILNSHPELVYRFEPLHRARPGTELALLRSRLESGAFGNADLPGAYEALRVANPATDKPPFFVKRGDSRPKVAGLALRQLVWMAAERAPALAGTYGRLFAPRGRPLVVFKEVTFEHVLAPILACDGFRAAYLVRHPCAVVSSTLAGQQAGLMSTGRMKVLASLLADHDPELAARVSGRLEAMSPAELNALLWRIEVEKGVAATRDHPRAMILVYEDLCVQTSKRVAELFAHFGLGFPDETRHFLEESSRAGRGARWRRGEQFIGDYFSVFRDTRESRDKWKTLLSAEDRKGVLGMVRDSSAFAFCARLGSWDVD